jgi:hypothetical protein
MVSVTRIHVMVATATVAICVTIATIAMPATSDAK